MNSIHEMNSDTPSLLKFADVVASPSRLMGYKAVWGRCIVEFMAFGAPARSPNKGTAYYSKPAKAANLAGTSPYLVAIGGGASAQASVDHRAIEVVRVSRAYGETNAFVRDPVQQAVLAQWPVGVALLEVYSILPEPDLVRDLGFPDYNILNSLFDKVGTQPDYINRLWAALADLPVIRRRDLTPLPSGFADPGTPLLVGTFAPTLKASSAEGAVRYKTNKQVERDPTLSRGVKENNRLKHGGFIICEGCDLADKEASLFDAHHLEPICAGIRESHVHDFAVLCPTCHRYAHVRGTDKLSPLNIIGLRQLRLDSNFPTN